MKRLLTVAAALATAAIATTANAQQQSEQRSYFQQRVAAPSSALELSLGTGYTEPLGMLEAGTGMPSVGLQGIGVDLGIAYRLNTRWSIGLGGQYHETFAPNAAAVRGWTAGVDAAFHVSPEARLDPWLGLGTGYRFMWVDHTKPLANVMFHGFELARARAGLDIRFSPGLAMGPVVGADMNLFLWNYTGGTNSAIADPRLSTFVFGGIQGRFDVGTMVGGEPVVATAPPPPPVQYTIITSAPLPPPAPVPAAQPVSPTIAVSDDLAHACNLTFNDPNKSPTFDRGKTDLQVADTAVLDKIASCLEPGGPLAGQKVYLIGRTDPRGAPAFNVAIGAKRAANVAGYLQNHGVDPAHITQTSRGAMDAKGTEEVGWQRDRRVDIILISP